MSNILLNGQKFDFDESDLPMSIHGKAGQGASYFSILVISELIKSGSKVLFFTMFPRGLAELNEHLDFKVPAMSILPDASEEKVVAIESGNLGLLQAALENPNLVSDRVVFIKNAESATEEIWNKVRQLDKVIVAGDLEMIRSLNPSSFKTRISFEGGYKATLEGPRATGELEAKK